MTEAGRDCLLLYAPVPLFQRDGILYLEDQACNGLRLWAENFAHVIVMHPLADGPPPESWVPLDRVGPNLARIEVVTLPMAYRPDKFLRALPETRRLIRSLIRRADFMSFAIGGLFGDWGSVACLEASRMGRTHAVWTDRVESAVTRLATTGGSWRKRLRARLTHRPMAALERHLIGRATVGLFHGADTFQAYAPYARAAELVHDIHIRAADHISPALLAAKIADVATGPLRLVYAGRAEPMKGGMDWVAVMERLQAKGVDFTACWLGTGSDLSAMQDRISAAGLQGRVTLAGFTRDRETVLDHLRAAHLFVFCHNTPESPRNLIEALVSGTPVIGYGSAYSASLIEAHQGGDLVPVGDIGGLADKVAALDADRARIADLIGRAAADGAPHHDAGVFRHRSTLIRKHLPKRLAGLIVPQRGQA